MPQGKRWLISRFNSVRGPYSDQELMDQMMDGKLTPQDFVAEFLEGKQPEWQLVSHLPALANDLKKLKEKVAEAKEIKNIKAKTVVKQATQVIRESDALIREITAQEKDLEEALFLSHARISTLESARPSFAHAAHGPSEMVDKPEPVITPWMKTGMVIAAAVILVIWVASTLNLDSGPSTVPQSASPTSPSETRLPSSNPSTVFTPGTGARRFHAPTRPRMSAPVRPVYPTPAEAPPDAVPQGEYEEDSQNSLNGSPAKGYIRERGRVPSSAGDGEMMDLEMPPFEEDGLSESGEDEYRGDERD